MKLITYLKREDITFAAMARRIGASNARTVERHAKGQRVPSRDAMAAYIRETDGAVQPNDFFEEAEAA